MVVGNVPEAADFVVIGAGPGGYAAALHAARAGRNVMLIDKDGDAGVGGVCLNVGCIPSKALIEAADLYHRAKASQSMGIPKLTGPFDPATFQAWRNQVTEGLTSGVRGLLRGASVTVVAGQATLTEPNVLVVSTPDDQARFVQFKSLVLATGSTPTPIEALPYDGVNILDSTGFLGLERLPETLAVVGGGYIGVELGTAAAKLGVHVTLVEFESRLLPQLEPALAGPVQRRLEALGVDVLTGTAALGFDPGALRVRTGSGPEASVLAEKVLVATGRTPNTTGMGLEVLGVPAAGGILPVGSDRRLTDRVAAIGDITPGPALAHKASAEALVAVDALNGVQTGFEPAAIPAIVFSDPEIASVGATFDDAKSQGVDAAQTRVPLGASGRAATLGTSNGLLQVVHDKADGAILGVHIASPHASELIAEATLAIEMGATLEDLSLTIHPHPTLGEQFAEASHLALGHPLHTAPPRK